MRKKRHALISSDDDETSNSPVNQPDQPALSSRPKRKKAIIDSDDDATNNPPQLTSASELPRRNPHRAATVVPKANNPASTARGKKRQRARRTISSSRSDPEDSDPDQLLGVENIARAASSMSSSVTGTITGTHKDDDDVVWFDIEVKCGTDSWKASRRYSEFDSLRNQLEEDGIAVTDFPRKHLFNTRQVIAERKIELSDFIKCCVLPNSSNPACRAFLDFDQGGADAEGVQIEQQGEQLLELFCTSPELTLSEYELDREQRVKRNHIMMGEMGIPILVQQQQRHPAKPKATQNRRGQNVTAESDHVFRRRSSRVTAMEDEEDCADEDESDSESEYDEDDEEEAPPPKKSRAKKKPTPAKKTAAKKKPAAKPANTRDDWIAQGFDAEAVDTAMEARPVLDTKSEIWDAMVERFKFWMEKTSEPFPPMRIGGLGKWADQQRQRKKGTTKGLPVLSKAEEDKLIKAGFVCEGGKEVRDARIQKGKLENAEVAWDAKFEQLKKFQLANDGREPKYSEDLQLYQWCQNQRQAYRGAGGTNVINDSQAERLKATGFDFTTGPGSGK